MNALLVLFFLTLLINDYIFKDGNFVRIYLYLFTGYYLIYLFTNKSKYHSEYKHILLAVFSQSFDPTVYGKLEFNVENSKNFLEEFEKKTNEKISWTLLSTKIIGLAIGKYPEFNSTIKCGRLIKRNNVDLSVLINVEGKVI